MPNEFQFSFSVDDIKKLIADGSDRVIITGKVVYDPKSRASAFEIYAENYQSASAMKVPGCPMPC